MIVVVAGTGTEVGKTWVTARVVDELRARSVSVAVRKPAQSFDPDDSAPRDADVLAASTGEAPLTVCPGHRWYERALAPPMAADALGLPPFTIAELVAEMAPTSAEVTFVESAGGVRSPLADDGDTVGLCRALHPDLVVLVADAGLGTINAVRLSANSLEPHATIVFLNRYDAGNDVHARNAEWLAMRECLDVVIDVEALASAIETRRADLRS